MYNFSSLPTPSFPDRSVFAFQAEMLRVQNRLVAPRLADYISRSTQTLELIEAVRTHPFAGDTVREEAWWLTELVRNMTAWYSHSAAVDAEFGARSDAAWYVAENYVLLRTYQQNLDHLLLANEDLPDWLRQPLHEISAFVNGEVEFTAQVAEEAKLATPSKV
jgi:hypothetical protein